MDKLILFIFCFIFCFIGRLTIYLISKLSRKKSKINESKNGIAVEMKYLINKFKLVESKIDKKSFAAIISFLDAIIISGSLIIVIVITDNTVFEMILGLIVVTILIYVIYEILGKILIKKGFDKYE